MISCKKNLAFFICGLLSLMLLGSCHKDQQHSVQIQSIDTYLFKKDGSFTAEDLTAFKKEHPTVANDFFYFILGVDTTQLNSTFGLTRINNYIHVHQILHESVNKIVPSLSAEEHLTNTLIENYKNVFHDTNFSLPPIYTYTAPIDAPTVALFRDWIGVNLSLLCGKDFEMYKGYQFSAVFPSYLHHRLEKRYLPYFILQQVLMDKYPLTEKMHSLMEKIINEGKFRYIIRELSPDKHDDRICMFPPEKLKWCEDNEKEIWNHIKHTIKDFYTIDPQIIRNYIGEAPKTEGMPDESPGNIGCWIGLQIVSSFMEKHSLNIQELIYTNPYEIFLQSGYNP